MSNLFFVIVFLCFLYSYFASMKYALVICLAFACTPKNNKSEEIENNAVLSSEIEAVDVMLQKDQQRIDSMERALFNQN